MKKIISFVVVLIQWIFLTGCGTDVEVGYSPPIVPVRISINSHGEIDLSLSPELVTPIGTFDLDVGATVYSLRDAYSTRLLIIRVDNQATVYELVEGQNFKINFDDDNKLYRKVALEYETDGDIILELESVNLVGESPVNAESTPANNPEMPPCSGVTITLVDTPKGDILHIEGCPNWMYDSPPLAKGAYALAPNNEFLIYCTNVGDLYAIRFRDSKTISLENLRKKMPVFRTGDVSLNIIVYEGEHQYLARITDQISGENIDVKIPLSVSQ